MHSIRPSPGRQGGGVGCRLVICQLFQDGVYGQPCVIASSSRGTCRNRKPSTSTPPPETSSFSSSAQERHNDTPAIRVTTGVLRRRAVVCSLSDCQQCRAPRSAMAACACWLPTCLQCFPAAPANPAPVGSPVPPPCACLLPACNECFPTPDTPKAVLGTSGKHLTKREQQLVHYVDWQ